MNVPERQEQGIKRKMITLAPDNTLLYIQLPDETFFLYTQPPAILFSYTQLKKGCPNFTVYIYCTFVHSNETVFCSTGKNAETFLSVSKRGKERLDKQRLITRQRESIRPPPLSLLQEVYTPILPSSPSSNPFQYTPRPSRPS